MTIINLEQHLFSDALNPAKCDIIFVSDMFASEYAGGAELTTQALLDACPFSVFKLKSRDVTMEMLEKCHQKYWIFGNYSQLNHELIPTICANLKYSIIEYDFKYCKYRSPEKHLSIEKTECRCENDAQGKMISAFMYGARSLWWMSEKQQASYEKLFPFLKEKISIVLSSVFDDRTFAFIKQLNSVNEHRSGWIIMGSPSWIKGTDEAKTWCESQGFQYKVLWGLQYEDVLKELSKAEGFVFLPRGADTCPRMVIEAKLLGCKLHLNENVQHKDEIWFDTKDQFDTEAYLYMARDRFWNGIRADMNFRPSISGYTTTKDCIKQDYPYIESIKSMIEFCDEVVVVDGGSTDGTWESLQELVKQLELGTAGTLNTACKLVIHQQKRDWNHPRFAVFDGAQKALARSLCTSDFCWQQDSDEIVHEKDYQKIRDLVKFIPNGLQLLSLPIIEYWGSKEKIRLDVNLWKWRLSRNLPHITHGIPAQMRQYDENGELFSKPGCDGCFYVKNDSYEVIPSGGFFTPDMEAIKRAALTNPNAKMQLEKWFAAAIGNLPTVFHFSWFNIERKIRTYRDYWTKHWLSLHNVSQDDTSENNMFFNKPWSEVSDEEIVEMARRLKQELGGWIFHRKVDFNIKVPHMEIDVTVPASMNEWMKKNS